MLYGDKNHIQNKATATANAVKRLLHRNVQIDAITQRVDDAFDSRHFNEVDLVITAVDNVEVYVTAHVSLSFRFSDFILSYKHIQKQARLYIDSQCVFRRLPLIDVSSLGFTAAVNAIIPHLTDS